MIEAGVRGSEVPRYIAPIQINEILRKTVQSLCVLLSSIDRSSWQNRMVWLSYSGPIPLRHLAWKSQWFQENWEFILLLNSCQLLNYISRNCATNPFILNINILRPCCLYFWILSFGKTNTYVHAPSPKETNPRTAWRKITTTSIFKW